jgi:hypothetical protein
MDKNWPPHSVNNNAWISHCYHTYVFEQEMNEGSSNNIPVLSYEFHFRLTAIIYDEWRVIMLVVVIAATVEVELQYKKP